MPKKLWDSESEKKLIDYLLTNPRPNVKTAATFCNNDRGHVYNIARKIGVSLVKPDNERVIALVEKIKPNIHLSIPAIAKRLKSSVYHVQYAVKIYNLPVKPTYNVNKSSNRDPNKDHIDSKYFNPSARSNWLI